MQNCDPLSDDAVLLRSLPVRAMLRRSRRNDGAGVPRVARFAARLNPSRLDRQICFTSDWR
eukprot:3224482-Pyramimonas_sp.AAC.1